MNLQIQLIQNLKCENKLIKIYIYIFTYKVFKLAAVKDYNK